MSKDHSDWCRNHFAKMDYGAIWGIPRSGMIFRRSGNVLLWVATIPPETSGLDHDQLQEMRQIEFAETMLEFNKGGVAVWRADIIESFDSIEAVGRRYGKDMSKARQI